MDWQRSANYGVPACPAVTATGDGESSDPPDSRGLGVKTRVMHSRPASPEDRCGSTVAGTAEFAAAGIITVVGVGLAAAAGIEFGEVAGIVFSATRMDCDSSPVWLTSTAG